MLTKHFLFQQSQQIACYLAFQNEFDTQPILQAIWQAGKQCYLPVLIEEIAGKPSLEFVQYHEGDPLQTNRYSILEPKQHTTKIAPDQLDLVITPLVAFDGSGHRLGMGAGYYDRTFAFLHQKKLTSPALLGLAYEIQRVENVPADPWDIALAGVVTEERLTVF